jgi:phosphoribosylglycinamide formyltransferase-1
VKRIAIFASGAGTNAEVIIRHFEFHADAQVTLLVTNKTDSGAVHIAREHGVEVLVVEKADFFSPASIVEQLKVRGINLIVLAGFLWLIPKAIIDAFPGKIVNIHPALLPKFGGKGMYGKYVHEAVLAAGEKESGITIHFVNEKFDEGAHVAQFKCIVEPGDTVHSLAQRIHELEHKHYAEAIEKLI